MAQEIIVTNFGEDLEKSLRNDENLSIFQCFQRTYRLKRDRSFKRTFTYRRALWHQIFGWGASEIRRIFGGRKVGWKEHVLFGIVHYYLEKI